MVRQLALDSSVNRELLIDRSVPAAASAAPGKDEHEDGKESDRECVDSETIHGRQYVALAWPVSIIRAGCARCRRRSVSRRRSATGLGMEGRGERRRGGFAAEL
jgi:hypothetical protein